MKEDIKVFGISLELVLIILLALFLILAVTLFLTIRQLQHVSRKYYILMSGKKGKDLEGIMTERFREMDQLKVQGHRALAEHQTFKGQMDAATTRVGIVKYDALETMAGNLSFAVAFLNEENTGIVFNVVHSREGCYSYAKEIIHGTSLTALSQEEREAIQKAIDSATERSAAMAAARAFAEKEAQELELETFFKYDEELTKERMQKASETARRQMREAAGEVDDETPVRERSRQARRKKKAENPESKSRTRVRSDERPLRREIRQSENTEEALQNQLVSEPVRQKKRRPANGYDEMQTDESRVQPVRKRRPVGENVRTASGQAIDQPVRRKKRRPDEYMGMSQDEAISRPVRRVKRRPENTEDE